MDFSISTPIVKPVGGSCNLACSYCYTPKQATLKCMSAETLRSTIDFFCSGRRYVEFIWHGGEPLLAQIDFYREVVACQKKWVAAGVRIANFIQTNATLVTEEWGSFFSTHGFFVGTSLDGPPEANNKNRHHSNGKGSCNEILHGIEILKAHGVFNGIICGVGKANYALPKELLSFFISNRIKKLKFAWLKNLGDCGDMSLISISFSQYIDFMIAIFDAWIELDDPSIEIRDIQSVVNLLLGGTARECIYMGQCDQFVTVYPDGSIYGCDSFPKTPSLYFGSVTEDPAIVKSNPRLKAFQETTRARKESCKECAWYFICKGGCAKDRYINLESREPLKDHCKELIRYFEHISAKIKKHNL